MNCGLLPPTLTPADEKPAETSAQAAAAAAGKTPLPAAAGGAGSSAAEEKTEADGGDGGGGGGGSGGGEDKDGDDKNKAFDPHQVASLMYHPGAVRTPNQRRTQAALLQVLIREVQRKFNEQVTKLMHQKLDEIDKIETRNTRIREITAELAVRVLWLCCAAQFGVVVQRLPVDHVSSWTCVVLQEAPSIFEPKLADEEDPKRVLTVSDAEVGFDRYVTAAERADLEAAELRKQQAAAAAKDDAPERALQQMMGGTLDVQDDLTKLQQSLVREAWMDELTEDQMSPEQKAQYDSYQAKQKALLCVDLLLLVWWIERVTD